MLPDKIAFVDLETTGTSMSRDRIIEVGILRVENGEVVKTYQSLINPHTYVSPYIEKITGIEASLLENAPIFADVKNEILEILDGCLFISHNVRFDYAFLKNEFSRIEIPFSYQKCCTVKLSRALFPQHKRHNLDSIIERFEIPCPNRHRAFDDAKVIFEFYQKLKNSLPEETLVTAIKKAQKRAAFPINIKEKEIDNLPESPGVYIFYGPNGAPLYVGKSINIKERVLSHFSQNDIPSDMKIVKNIESIDAIKTAGELSALILEANLIKKLQPIFNKTLRRTQELIAIIKLEDNDGYFRATIQKIKTLEEDDIEHVLGVFKSKRDAVNFLRTIAKENNLCPKLLDIEKTKKGCLSQQFGWCKGACLKKEDPVLYNLRFSLAFTKSRIGSWPYKGPIVIKETDPETRSEEAFIVNKWCYIKYEEFAGSECALVFDLDIYKILKKYLQKPSKNIAVNLLPI